MADDIPAGLKQGDINLFKTAQRAAQLQTVKPIVAYWCEYWVVNQILARSLHSTSEEMLNYTTHLMDKLEQTKVEYANEEAVTDDAAAQAYIEQFAQETLDRAERVVKAGKVTQQTATTFDAAATFFHLVNIWGPADAENQQKIKYAKWNAARIAKAIKEGKDPNESNPAPQETPQPPVLDLSDPEVRGLTSPPEGTAARPVTIEDVPDDGVPRDAAGVSLPHSPASAVPPSFNDELTLPGVPTGLADQQHPQPGYFDNHTIPSPVSPPSHTQADYHAAEPPSVPQDWQPTPPPPAEAAFSPPPPQSQHQYQPPPQPPTFAPSPARTAAVAPPPFTPPTVPEYIAPAASFARPTAPPQPSVPQGYATAAQPTGHFTRDEAAMAQAQKHARWAISALNFEDVPTAVKELRKALETLGAT